MERILHNEGYDELPDLPGIMCTCATVNCYNEKILYDSIYIVCKNEKVVKNIMSKIFKEDILDLSDQDDMCKCIYNATPQELYDLLKAATDLWVTK